MAIVILVVLALIVVPAILEARAKAKKQREQEEAARQRAYDQEVARQNGFASDLVSHCKGALDDYERLPKHLITAEGFLDQAEGHY
jgi:type II secretory pathway pseudopilin PulG